MRSHRKLPTTALKVLEETSRKSQLCPTVLRSTSICRFISRSASAFLVAGAALVVSSSAFAQEEAPSNFSPPVHVQPAAWSVLENAPAATRQIPVAPPVQPASRSSDIANMAAYMRMQNQAVTSAKNAQVNAALNQVQHSRLASAQGQAFPRTTASAARQQYQPPRYQYPAPRYQPPAQQQVPQTQQPLYVAPPRNVVQQSQAPQQAPQQIQQRPAEQFVQRQVIQQRPAAVE